jgi:hypothetical protein
MHEIPVNYYLVVTFYNRPTKLVNMKVKFYICGYFSGSAVHLWLEYR